MTVEPFTLLSPEDYIQVYIPVLINGNLHHYSVYNILDVDPNINNNLLDDTENFKNTGDAASKEEIKNDKTLINARLTVGKYIRAFIHSANFDSAMLSLNEEEGSLLRNYEKIFYYGWYKCNIDTLAYKKIVNEFINYGNVHEVYLRPNVVSKDTHRAFKDLMGNL